MKVLVVYCHPSPQSFTHAALERVLAGLAVHHNEVEVIDLYGEGFDPVLRLDEWTTYIETPEELEGGPMQRHYALLRWAEGLVFVHPTWMFGLPAMLKGWLDRTFAPGVSFSLPASDDETVKSQIRHIELAATVTSTGTPWWVMAASGMPGRRLLHRSIRLGYAVRCRKMWLCLHGIEGSTEEKRTRHLDRVERAFAKVK